VIPETLRIVVMSETQPRRDPAAFDFYRRAITSYELGMPSEILPAPGKELKGLFRIRAFASTNV
jgi:hypothetical protein